MWAGTKAGLEIGFFHRVKGRDSHIEDPRYSGKMHWSENKGLPAAAGWLIHDQGAQRRLPPKEVQPLGREAPPTHTLSPGGK